MNLTGDRNQCPGCSKLFNSTSAFDKHRTGTFGSATHKDATRRCMTTEEMIACGMAVSKRGYWVGSLMPDEVLQTVTS